MQIVKISPENFNHAYGIQCQFLFDENVDSPFGMTWCEIPAHGSTESGQHAEYERFLILKGQGIMQINAEKKSVTAYDLIEIPPFSEHQLKNASDVPLVFLSIYADGLGVSQKITAATIFSSPPTPNGDFHLGHLSGPYLAADALKRYFTLRNGTARHVIGSDDFQSYVAYQAEKENKQPSMVATYYRNRIEDALNRCQISYDEHYHPQNDLGYQEFVQEFFLTLLRKNQLVCKEIDTPYCESCDIFLVEGFVSGACPRCLVAVTGPACEACGFVADLSGQVADPVCRTCNKAAEFKKLSRHFFPLEAFKNKLKTHLNTAVMSINLRNFVNDLLALEWQDIPVTSPNAWGIPVPVSSGLVQTIHPWFEMAAAYARYQSNKNNILCFGADNRFYYMVYNPALMLAYDSQAVLPATYLSNEFYYFHNQKISKSRSSEVNEQNFFEKYNIDVLRWFLAHTRPEQVSSEFSLLEFHHFIDQVIAKRLNVLIETINKRQPIIGGALTQWEKEFIIRLRYFKRQSMLYYNPANFSLRKVSHLLVELLTEVEGWQSAHTHGVVLVCALKVFAMMAYPILPAYAGELLSWFGLSAWENDLSIPTVVPDKPLPKLFVYAESRQEACCVE